jgi:hypothetical protein
MRLATEGLWPVISALALALGAGSLAACTPSIGDSCQLSTDCASDGTRICDTSEPGGYCTVLNCTGNNLGASCPDNAVCILFNANIPGCPFSARRPASTGVSQCRNTCGTNSDWPPLERRDPRSKPDGEGLPACSRLRRRWHPDKLHLRVHGPSGRCPARLPGSWPLLRFWLPSSRRSGRRSAGRRGERCRPVEGRCRRRRARWQGRGRGRRSGRQRAL